MDIIPGDLTAEQSYKLLTGMVVPRPIAWVTTLSSDGVANLAPFSAFTFVSPKPPMLAISVGSKAGVYKDTARNILAREEYVVHIADQPLIEKVHRSAIEYAPEVDEIRELGLKTVPSRHVAPPRIEVAPVALECRLRQCLEFGDTRSRLLVGEIVHIHLRDDLVVDGKIDTMKLNPIARIAGPTYATLGEIIRMTPIAQTTKTTITRQTDD